MVLALVRTVVMYAVILLGVRLMGKRQISQLQTSELVVTLLISELAVLPIQERDLSLLSGIVPMGALVLCEVGVSLWMLKSGRFRRAVCGRPELVIREGQLMQEALRRLRMTTEELFEQLRLAGAFSLEEVAWAVVETNGRMSVAKKAGEDPLTPKQAGVKAPPRALEMVVLSDGVLDRGSLALCGRDEGWVRDQLRQVGLREDQVFLLTVRGGRVGTLVKKEPLPR